MALRRLVQLGILALGALVFGACGGEGANQSNDELARGITELVRAEAAFGQATCVNTAFDLTDPTAVQCATGALYTFSDDLNGVQGRLATSRSDMSSECQQLADVVIDNTGPLAREAAKLASAYETAAQTNLSQDSISSSENAFVDTYGKFGDDALKLVSQFSSGSCKVSEAALTEFQNALGGG
jgi:hypothetical protein